MTRQLAASATALMMVVLTGCGIPTENAPRQIEPPSGPYRTTAPTAPATTVAGPVVEQLCLVRDDKLVKVKRRVRSEPTVDRQLQHLLAGPTEAESDARLTSALTGTNLVVGVKLLGTEAIVEVGNNREGPSRSDELLAYGQIVCTLDSRIDVNGVFFMQEGQRLGIPRADGSLSRGPLTMADYATLISGS